MCASASSAERIERGADCARALSGAARSAVRGPGVGAVMSAALVLVGSAAPVGSAALVLVESAAPVFRSPGVGAVMSAALVLVGSRRWAGVW